jgi:hypothetical protein
MDCSGVKLSNLYMVCKKKIFEAVLEIQIHLGCRIFLIQTLGPLLQLNKKPA